MWNEVVKITLFANRYEMMVKAPSCESELISRVKQLAGLTLQQAAAQFKLDVPPHLKIMKGWVGQLIEKCLGTDAGNAPIPDFSQLGIELKTIPINHKGLPMESTFVSVVPLSFNTDLVWEKSEIYFKLKRVLWIPIEADHSIPLSARRIGHGILWSPNYEIEAVLKNDWEELMNMVAMGEINKITAHFGTYLQIRPKAAKGSSLCVCVGEEGKKIMTLPRGFYLRTCFTKMILKDYYL